MLLGVLCLLASVGFVVHNRHEAKNGAQFSQNLLQSVHVNMYEAERVVVDEPEKIMEETLPEFFRESAYREMQTVPAETMTALESCRFRYWNWNFPF